MRQMMKEVIVLTNAEISTIYPLTSLDDMNFLEQFAEPLYVVRNLSRSKERMAVALGELVMIESNSLSNKSPHVFLKNTEDEQAAKRLKDKIKKIMKSMLQ